MKRILLSLLVLSGIFLAVFATRAGSASDPAGAVIDHNTFAKMKSLGLDPRAYLDNNDATAFFAATGDLLLTGPTLTNVNDVRVILVE